MFYMSTILIKGELYGSSSILLRTQQLIMTYNHQLERDWKKDHRFKPEQKGQTHQVQI